MLETRAFLFYMRPIYILILASLTLLSCVNSNENELAEQIFKELQPEQAYVLVDINNERFYPEVSRFIGNINLGSNYSDINIIDQYGGNIQLQMSKNNWLQNDEMIFKVSPNTSMAYPNYGSMLIGRKNAKKLEGYILSRAIYKWTILNKRKAILKFEGYIVRPQDAVMPENEISLKGTVYFKQPHIDLNDLDAKTLEIN
jgi:hypothetical protein